MAGKPLIQYAIEEATASEYVLEPVIWEAIEQTSPDKRGEVQLTDSVNVLCQKHTIRGLCLKGRHYDAGDLLGYLNAQIELSLGDPVLSQPNRGYLRT